MLTTFSMWLIYLASYGVAYLFLMLEIVIVSVSSNADPALTTLEKMIAAFSDNALILIVLLALLLLSIIIHNRIDKWKNNCRIRFSVNKNCTFESSWMIASFILPLICCGFNLYIGLVILMVVLLTGIAVIKGGYFHTCLLFLLKRNYVYTNDSGAVVITKMKMEKYNLLIRDNPNGVEARRIYRDIYYRCSD